MSETAPYPYNIGTLYPVMPVPANPAHCITVEAGAVQLVVEARDLIEEINRGRPAGETVDEDSAQFNDFGASLHVFGRADGVEYLRFDCFEKEPHYHYIRAQEGANVICRLDDIAESDPIEWTVTKLRTRLPEMLDYAGASELAAGVREDPSAVTDAAGKIEELLIEARRRAIARRATGATLAP